MLALNHLLKAKNKSLKTKKSALRLRLKKLLKRSIPQESRQLLANPNMLPNPQKKVLSRESTSLRRMTVRRRHPRTLEAHQTKRTTVQRRISPSSKKSHRPKSSQRTGGRKRIQITTSLAPKKANPSRSRLSSKKRKIPPVI